MTAVVCWAPVLAPWPDATLDAVRRLIPVAQIDEIMRFRNWRDRQARFLARLALRAILREQFVPATLDGLSLSPEGRPSIAGAGDFSIAHTTTIAVCAWVRTGRVGIDVESARRELSTDDLMPWMSPSERHLIATSSRSRDEALRLWTAKEAVCKADGCGIASGGLPDCAGTRVEFNGNTWRVRSARRRGHTFSLARDADASPGWRTLRLRNIKLSAEARDLGIVQHREQSPSRGLRRAAVLL